MSTFSIYCFRCIHDICIFCPSFRLRAIHQPIPKNKSTNTTAIRSVFLLLLCVLFGMRDWLNCNPRFFYHRSLHTTMPPAAAAALSLLLAKLNQLRAAELVLLPLSRSTESPISSGCYCKEQVVEVGRCLRAPPFFIIIAQRLRAIQAFSNAVLCHYFAHLLPPRPSLPPPAGWLLAGDVRQRIALTYIQPIYNRYTICSLLHQSVWSLDYLLLYIYICLTKMKKITGLY